jgi:hypothetical protein
MKSWKRRDDWVGTQVEDHLVMINVESGRYVALNDTAAEAWRLLEEPQDQEALVTALTGTFNIDRETCTQSVTDLMERMRSLDLIEDAA